MRNDTQESQVIEAMRKEGGFATFKQLNEILDFSSWKSKTPEASVRRIVQNSKAIFRIQPGLWALEAMREEVLKRFNLKQGDKKSEEQFSHGYYQGLLVEIGKCRHLTTYVPPQDKSRLFLGQKLGDVADIINLPQFTYFNIYKKARTIDVIWLNDRGMPNAFYEVEHTTDIKNSLIKFYELQDFAASFTIVASAHRKAEFDDKICASIFSPIAKRVRFDSYDKIAAQHEALSKAKEYL